MNSPSETITGRQFSQRYTIVSEIGSGGWGTVYRAHHRLLNVDVAIKILHQDLVRRIDVMQRFEQEARTLARLSHPNIVLVSDYGLLPEPHMVMEFLDGISLSGELVEKGPLSGSRVLNILLQICQGLHYGHQQGLVHRDLKPANIMLVKDPDRGETVKILDFGFAKMTEDSQSQKQDLTRTGELIGSPPYMSPEQCQGRAADARSDIYALGCMIYEMLSGRRIFNCQSPVDWLYKHVSEKPAPLAELLDDTELNRFFSALAMNCLEKDPLKRPANLEDIKKRLAEQQAALRLANEDQDRPQFSAAACRSPGRTAGRQKLKRIASVAVAGLIALSATVLTACFFRAQIFRSIWELTLSMARKSLAAGRFDEAEREAQIAELLLGEVQGAKEFVSTLGTLVKIEEKRKDFVKQEKLELRLNHFLGLEKTQEWLGKSDAGRNAIWDYNSEAAIPLFQEALGLAIRAKADGLQAITFWRLANAYLRTGNYTEAMAANNTAAAIANHYFESDHPYLQAASLRFAQIYLAAGQLEMARSWFNQIKPLPEGDPELSRCQGMLCIREGEFARAEEVLAKGCIALEKSLTTSQTSTDFLTEQAYVEPYLEHAVLISQLGRSAEAEARVKKLRERVSLMKPDVNNRPLRTTALADYTLARILYLQRKREEAGPLLKSALERAQNLKMTDYITRMQNLEKEINGGLPPVNAVASEIACRQGASLLKNGQYRQALDRLNAAVNDNPANLVALRARSLCHKSLNDEGQANEDAEKASRLERQQVQGR
jgi:tetratricopeptide (TPR) repeat protein/tRNA A-37 threonylcarbamoyl transferase component Bud32